MTRLTQKSPDELTPQQREQYDRIGQYRQARADGTLGGPFDAWIRSPELARRATGLGNFIWNRTTLERRIVEFAIAITARVWEANVEWVAHAEEARKRGVSDDVLASVLAGQRPEGAPEDELLTYDFCKSLHETRRLPIDLYQRAVSLFGEQGLMEMIGTIGYYTFVSMTLNAFEVGVESGVGAPFER